MTAQIVENKTYLVSVTGISKSKYACDFKTGDVVSFKNGGKTIVRNGRKIKHDFTKANLRMFGSAIELDELNYDNINKKVVTKAVAWGMRVFGDKAPTNGQVVMDKMIESGLDAFKAVAAIVKTADFA